MHCLQSIVFCISALVPLWRTVYCVPAPPRSGDQNSAEIELTPFLDGRRSDFLCQREASRPASSQSANVGIDHTVWNIDNDFRLVITICNWEPDPVDRNFQQRSANRYNTLYFEIRPGYDEKKLTWSDVGEVLGENGLAKYYETRQQWNTIYFGLMHKTRGELGFGAVRRWWQ